jgi:predicted AlkP superfamily pyrophosphatase or phosphodiesterase
VHHERHGDAAERMESALIDVVLADRVEMVLRPVGPHRYRAASVLGSVEFERDTGGPTPSYRVRSSTGIDPLAELSADRWIGAAAERTNALPDRQANAYPHAFDSIAQFFDAPHAPDLVAMHTAAHAYGNHLGQHGSLGVTQARAPFIAAGPGVRSQGLIDSSTRTVDIAPTIAALLGVAPHPESIGPTGERRVDGLLRRQDGDPMAELLDGERAEHVVVLLLDGCNANLLHEVIDAGEAPHIAALLARGTGYGHGAIASLPTATLANHTTAVTGAHPGHSGVLHNTWVDRRDGSTPDLLAYDQMFWAMRHLSPDVETLFDAIERTWPGAFSSATFEFCDTGASFSSFALVRDRAGADLPDAEQVTHADPGSVASSEAYAFMSRVDHLSVAHTVACWDREHGNELPRLSWCSLAVTDEAGHESGPHGALARAAVVDSDARVGEVIAAVERAGALERTAFVVMADHGMEQADPALTRPWDDDLVDCGVGHRIVGDGLVYLDRQG